mgnify:CR=1 FL=1
MIRVFQVKCAYENEVEAQLIKKLHIKKEDLLGYTIHRRSVDARHQKVLFSYVIDCSLKNEKKVLKHKDVQPCPDETYHFVSSGTQESLIQNAMFSLEKVVPGLFQMGN